jgi:hypothetical protein
MTICPNHKWGLAVPTASLKPKKTPLHSELGRFVGWGWGVSLALGQTYLSGVYLYAYKPNFVMKCLAVHTQGRITGSNMSRR